jgi:hypothetical protein
MQRWQGVPSAQHHNAELGCPDKLHRLAQLPNAGVSYGVQVQCPFAHAGEKAVRRDPRTHDYTGIACPDMKKQSTCIRGDKCPYAHNVFEYWLHPTRWVVL